MNERAVPGAAGGYLLEYRDGDHRLGRTAVQLAGLCLVASGVVITVVGTTFGQLSFILGIFIALLGATLLVTLTLDHSRLLRRFKLPHGPANVSRNVSVASELAVLADLYSSGALSAEEFSAAKRRILDL
ncbi:SHOCT domain-containing protein [Arthrobacter sp. SAFR-179]|uniref:SHOCT domain-containing protein n=1 Tax=Arthrobacter sp. SAFR-179 TaxID=3387279 RepID=UPI003F7C7C47